MAQNDVLSRINALGGGEPLPQADTMAIAKRLLGPDLAERYGDAIGARPMGVADIARDIAIGAISKDPYKADQLKAQVAQNYNEQLAQQEKLAMARDAENRQKISAFFSVIRSVKDVPKQFRKDFLAEAFGKIGMEASPLTAKVLANPEVFNTDDLLSPDMQALADDDPEKFLEQATGILGDGQSAIEFLRSLQGLKQQRVQTQNMILAGRRSQSSLAGATDPNAKRRAALIGRLVTQQVMDDATGEKRFLTKEEIDEVVARADAAGAFGPPTGIPQEAPVGLPQEMTPPTVAIGLPQATTTTATTTAPTTTAATAPASTAPAGQITGVVQRVK